MTDIETNYPIYKQDEYPPDENVKVNGAPGTGKTTQTTKGRLIHEIKRRNLTYLDYTVCTYRRSLSDELISALHDEEVLSRDIAPEDTFIGTIHAICRRLINTSSVDVQVSEVVTERHKQVFCEQYGQTYFTQSYQKSAGEVLFDVFNYMLNNNITPKHLPEEKISKVDSVWGATTQSDIETTAVDIQKLWNDWEDFKQNPPDEIAETELWDFDELLLLVRKHNLIPPNEFLIIDEMHDAYPLLNDVVQMWIKETRKDESKTVIIAGDPHQVINEYQGSTPKYFNQTNLPEIVLETTYRCPEQVWEYAESIIAQEFTPKDVTPHNSNGSVTEYNGATFTSPKDADKWILQEDSVWTPHKLLHTHLYADSETQMILTRTRTQLHAIATHLDEYGIIYGGTIPSSWTEQKHLLHIYNTLQTLLQIDEEPETTNYDEGVSYTFSNEHIITKDRLQAFISYLPNKYLKNISTENITQYLSDLPKTFSINETHFILQESVFTDNIYDILSSMSLSEEEHTKLHNALQNGDNTQILDTPQISLHTIHESKGMQAETVILYDGITHNIYESLSTESGLQNECRVWYVAASRSSKHLAIVRNAFENFYPSPYLPHTTQ